MRRITNNDEVAAILDGAASRKIPQKNYMTQRQATKPISQQITRQMSPQRISIQPEQKEPLVELT